MKKTICAILLSIAALAAPAHADSKVPGPHTFSMDAIRVIQDVRDEACEADTRAEAVDVATTLDDRLELFMATYAVRKVTPELRQLLARLNGSVGSLLAYLEGTYPISTEYWLKELTHCTRPR